MNSASLLQLLAITIQPHFQKKKQILRLTANYLPELIISLLCTEHNRLPPPSRNYEHSHNVTVWYSHQARSQKPL